jgi:hypothetical protein
MNKDDLENFVPVFTIGYVGEKFICGINPTEEGISAQHVIGACISIIDGYLSLLDESDQNDAENAVFEALHELKDSRHEYLEKIKFDDKGEYDEDDDFEDL